MGQTFAEVRKQVQSAFDESLRGNQARAQELLLYSRHELKRLSGDLPIVAKQGAVPFATHSHSEAEAWGWLEMASGVHQLQKARPGAGLVHFKRSWRIWRQWSLHCTHLAEKRQAQREKLRAGLWLGECWGRVMGDRSLQVANAVLRAALKELAALGDEALLQETIAQQRLLPMPAPGSPAYNSGGQSKPLLCSLLPPNQRS